MTRVITASCGTAWPQEQRLDIRKPRTEIEQVTLNPQEESVMAHSNMMTWFYLRAASESREIPLIGSSVYSIKFNTQFLQFLFWLGYNNQKN